MGAERTVQKRRALKVLMGEPWQDALIKRLNMSPEEAFADYVVWANALFEGPFGGGSFMPLAPDRHERHREELKRLVDLYLEGGNRSRVARGLNLQLLQQPEHLTIVMNGDRPAPPEEKGAAYRLRSLPFQGTDILYPEDWRNFVRLLASPLAERFRKCPECGKYFLAKRRKNQRYCSGVCVHRAADRNYRNRHGDEYRERKRKAMRRLRQRKKHHPT